jgi:hypothetical protein
MLCYVDALVVYFGEFLGSGVRLEGSDEAEDELD